MNKHKNRTKAYDLILKFLTWFFASVTMVSLMVIIAFILIKGLPHISLEFLTTIYRGDQTGIISMIINTLFIVAVTLLISVPIGILSGIYLVEYAKQGKLVRIIRFATETLSGIPSIIFGLFGLIFFVTFLKLNWSILSGSLTLSIIVLPLIIRTTEETLKSVPIEYREASLALGATKLRTIFKVVMPCAIPGILTAVILSIGRIVGETAALIFTSGMVTKTAKSIMHSGRTLSLHLYQLAREGISDEQAFASAAVLLVLVLIINLLSNKTAKKLTKYTSGDKNNE